MDDAKLWRVEDVMSYAGIKSRSSLYPLIKKGLPIIKISKSIRFNPESVITFFNDMEETHE